MVAKDGCANLTVAGPLQSRSQVMTVEKVIAQDQSRR